MRRSTFPSDDPTPMPRFLSLLLLVGVPLLVILAIRLPYFGVLTLNEDEGLYAMVARAMQQGGLPYRDAWDHAAPGIFTLYWLVFVLFGSWNMFAIRIVALIAHLISSVIVGAAVRERHGSVAGIIAASLTAVSLGGYLALDAVAALTETFLVPFLLAFTLLVLRWAQGEKFRAIPIAILWAFAIWFKIHALFLGGAVLLGAGIARVRAGDNELSILWLLVKSVLFAFAAYLLLVLPMFVQGGFAAYWATYIRYNILYLGVGGYGGSFFSGLLQTAWQWGFPQFLVIALIVAKLLGRSSRRLPNDPARLVLGLGLLAGFIVGIMGGRLFGHYFLPAAAFAGWLAGEGAGLLIREMRQAGARWNSISALTAGVVLLTGLISPILYFHAGSYSLRWGENADPRFVEPYKPLVHQLDAFLEPGEEMWIWGFAPDIYVHAERDCPTRFINCNYLVGLIPWVNAERHINTTEYIVPGSWALLMQDLRNDPPAAIIDTATPNLRFWGKYPLRGSPGLMRFLEENYREVSVTDDYPIYLRRDIADREDM